MAGADSDCKGVAAGTLNELLNIFGAGVGRILGGNIDLVLNAGESSKFSFNNNTVVVSILNHLLGECNVVLKALGRSVDHNGGKAAVNAALADFKRIAVVEVNTNGKSKSCALFSVLNSSFNKLHKINVLCVAACAFAYLKNKGCALLDRSLGNTLNYLHIVYVESTDSIAAIIGFFKHFLGSYDRH